MLYFGNLSQDGKGDPDNDGLTNAEEYAAGQVHADHPGRGRAAASDVTLEQGNRSNQDYDEQAVFSRMQSLFDRLAKAQ